MYKNLKRTARWHSATINFHHFAVAAVACCGQVCSWRCAPTRIRQNLHVSSPFTLTSSPIPISPTQSFLERVVSSRHDALVACTMSWPTYVALCFIHALYSTFRFIRSYWQSFENAPQPLNTARQKLPAHLALMLVQDNGHSLESQRDIMVQNVERVTGWCRDVGIEKLTVFDREGESRGHLVRYSG